MTRETSIRGVLAALAMAASFAVNALTLPNAPGMIISDDLPVEPGVWNTNFSAAKKLADENGIPMIVFWADPSCGQCKKLETACATSTIINWQEAKKYVFVFGYGKGGEGSTIKAFAKPPDSTRWPYCAVYWKGKTLIRFTGRSSDPTIPAAARKGTLAQQFINVCDMYAGEYEVDVFPGGTIESVDPEFMYFPNQSTDQARDVELELVREKVGATNQNLTVTYPSGKVETNVVAWAASETSKTLKISIKRSEYVPGSNVTFRAFNAKGAVLDEAELGFVEAPYLGGSFVVEPGVLEAEPTVDSLDLDLVRDVKDTFSQTIVVTYKKAPAVLAGTSGRTLAGNPGSDTVEKVVAVDWAKDVTNKVVTVEFADADKTAGNKVSIALKDGDETVGETDIEFIAPVATSIDNPKWIGEDFDYGEWTMDLDAALAKGGRILAATEGTLWCTDCANVKSYLQYQDEFIEWARDTKVTLVTIDLPSRKDPNNTLLSYASEGGAKYLSRKGISSADAKDIYDRNHQLAYEDWKLSDQERTGVPTFFAVRDDGTVAGRITEYTTSSSYIKNAGVAPTILRLEELLALKEDDAEEDTELAMCENSFELEESVKGTLSGADTIDMYEMEVGADAMAKLTLSPSSELAAPAEVTLALSVVAEDEDGEDYLEEIATATGDLSQGYIALDCEVDGEAEYYVTVRATRPAATNKTNLFALAYPGDATAPYTLSSSVLVIPAESSKSYTTSSGFLAIRVVEDEIYRIQGIGDITGVEGLEDVDGKGLYFRATDSGDVVVPTQYGAGEATVVTYQIWQPGEFEFVKTEQTAFSFNGAATVAVQRTGGSSGAASVKLTVKEQGGTIEEGRVTIPQDLTLSWNDGESGEKSITVTLFDNQQFSPSEYTVFGLEAVKLPTGATLDDETDHKLTVSDSTDPVFEETEYDVGLYQNFASGVEFGVYNVTNGTVTLTKKSGALPAGVTLKYDSVKKAVVLSGTPTVKGTFTASFTITTTVGGKKTTGTPTTFTLTVDDPAEKNPYTNKAYNNTCAVIHDHEDGTIVVGELTVSVTAKNRITAKFQSTESTVTTFTGAWEDIESETGTALAMLKNSKGSTLVLSLDTEGTISGALEGVSNYFEGPLTVNETPAKETGVWKSFTGYYTVTLPNRDICAGEAEAGSIYEPHGTGYITFTMTSTAAVRNGRVTYVGYLPDGQYVNGSVSLTANPENAKKAKLYIFKRAQKDVTGIAVTICADAAETCDDTSQLQVIKDIPGFVNYMLHRETNGRYEYAVTLLAYGGYFTKSLSPLKICEMFDYEDLYLSRKFAVSIDPSYAADGINGSIASVPSAVATAKSSGFSLSGKVGVITMSYAKATGIVSGTARVTFSSGKYLTGTYKCALLPGWDDCGCGDGTEDIVTRPFASGTLYFTEKEPVSGLQIKRSIPVDLNVITEE